MAAAAVVVVLMGIDISTALPLLFDILLSLLRRQLFILILLGPKIQLVRKQTKCFCEAAAAAAGATDKEEEEEGEKDSGAGVLTEQ
ncbi:hypothetical protein TYRP_003954 [Tyrophagus putrescentiae]|nr:hypothetical protein TYRP_003954 [Tyrophagus putrescentiae]